MRRRKSSAASGSGESRTAPTTAPMTCSDTQLQDEIRRRLAECARTPDPHEATLEHLDTRNVDICVEGGKVILTGTVAERRMKHRIEELVDACPGVQDIDNQIRVQV